jgi:hypothetical protein
MSFQSLNYPLNIRFKLVALAPRMYVTDANGQDVFFVSQKVLALKEDVRIYDSEAKTRQLYQIRADRIIDFSARYHFLQGEGGPEIGSIKHKGMRSIWKATYIVSDAAGQETHRINEDNPWIKVADALFGEVPILGMFTGYVFNPSYTVHELGTEKPILQMSKEPSLFGRSFNITKPDAALDPTTEQRLILALMMMVQMERSRG